MTPMTLARGMGTLPELVVACEGTRSVKRLFDRVGVPLAIMAEPERMLPLRDLVDLFETAAHITGDPLLGLRVGIQMADKFGAWSRYARSAPDLRGGLARGTRTIGYHQTGTRLELTVEGDVAKYAYHMELRRPDDGRQHLEHTLPALLSTFRSYAGANWRPLHIEVDYPADRRLADIEDMLAIPIHADAPAMAVVFDASELDLPFNSLHMQGPPVTRFELNAMVRQRPPTSLAGIVAEIVRTRLLEGQADIEGVAERLDTGARSLQRKLDNEGWSYRQILGDVRLSRARHLLAETHLPITEIAFMLGYSDPAHFTRAFRRADAVSPNAYRRIHG